MGSVSIPHTGQAQCHKSWDWLSMLPSNFVTIHTYLQHYNMVQGWADARAELLAWEQELWFRGLCTLELGCVTSVLHVNKTDVTYPAAS